MTQFKLETDLCPLYLTGSGDGLSGVFWREQDVSFGTCEVIEEAARQIEEYLAGARREFALKLAPRGTPFQRRVWDELAKIPYGETRSYAAMALAVGQPGACRAVGTANGRNPLSIIVPCHRVINASGKLGGYAGSLSVKERLLTLEGAARGGLT